MQLLEAATAVHDAVGEPLAWVVVAAFLAGARHASTRRRTGRAR